MPLFSITIFIGSFLLFMVQPMISKMLLPSYGGSASVWLTCMVFFQAMLLAGYGYVHLTTRHFSSLRQKALHFLLWVAAIFFLPIRPSVVHAIGSASPAFDILRELSCSAAVPFIAMASTAPLLQRWFGASSLRGSDNPYPLYSVSNIGSLVGLFAYPFIVEPELTLTDQSQFFAAAFALSGLLVSICAIVSSRAIEAALTSDQPVMTSNKTRLRWLVLSFVPSSLLLGVTSVITTDIAAIPLIWVIPLGIYLVTFALAFARRTFLSHRAAARMAALVILLVTAWTASDSIASALTLVPFLLHLALLFLVALSCHGELASFAPERSAMTEYYLWIALGGFIGGVFNSLLAPLLFDRIMEFQIVLIAAAFLAAKISDANERRFQKSDMAIPLLIVLLFQPWNLALRAWCPFFEDRIGFVVMAVPVLAILALLRRPLGFSLAIAVLLAIGAVHDSGGGIFHRSRSFFGVSKVSRNENPPTHLFHHGTTIHGSQRFDEGKIDMPLSYYHPAGPIGMIFSEFTGSDSSSPVAVVGLGVGTLAAYADEGRRMDFYEIDPVIERIARDRNLFRYMERSRGKLRVIIGDGRLALRDSGDSYGIIFLDAFSSDAVPVHLLTREAVDCYLNHLADSGILVFNISNRYLDLAPVLAGIARNFSMECLTFSDVRDAAMEKEGFSSSAWIVMGRSTSILDRLRYRSPKWTPATSDPSTRIWTDDYSPIMSIFRWR